MIGDAPELLSEFFSQDEIVTALGSENVDDDLFDGAIRIGNGSSVGLRHYLEIEGKKAIAGNRIGRIRQSQSQLKVIVEREVG